MQQWSQVSPQEEEFNPASRIWIIGTIIILFGGVIIWRLFDLQIMQASAFKDRAIGQHLSSDYVPPERGDIYLNDGSTAYKAVANQNVYVLYAQPDLIAQPQQVADKIYSILGLPYTYDPGELSPEAAKADKQQKAIEEVVRMMRKMQKKGDPYEPLRTRVTEDKKKQIESLGIEGLGFIRQDFRFYPEPLLGGQIFGFVGETENGRTGNYGIEGYYNQELAGSAGKNVVEKDASGNAISIASQEVDQVQDGSDIYLTIDRQVQLFACRKLQEYVDWFEAEGGTVVIMEPYTGAIITMCNTPDYDPAKYNEVDDINKFNNNSIFTAYEPGSVLKTMTMAAAINEKKLKPTDTYIDEGFIEIDDWKIKNSDLKAHGEQTMTQVLEESLNTGSIYAMRAVGTKKLVRYLEDFGFGELTGIDLDFESPGDVKAFKKKGEIFAATASYGQGFTATPIQLTNAYAAIVNGGKLMKPYVVESIHKSDGEIIEGKPQVIRQVISERTAQQVKGMLISVVNNGHGQSAGVEGYRIGGKTGTAQIASKEGGYEEGEGSTIGTFVGFAPFDNPRFVMLTKIERPHKVSFADQSAAPLFKEIAEFLFQHYNIPRDF